MQNGKSDITPTKEELRIASLPEFERKMRESAAVVSSIIGLVAGRIKPGVKLTDLELYAFSLIKEFKAESYNLGYKPAWAATPFPSVLSTSVNNCIAHGIPTEYELKEGDLVNLDLGIKFNGVCGDCAMTVPVGQIENKHERLLRFANRACYMGIQQIKAGVSVADIGRAIETYAMQMGYVTNQVFSGHDIGEEMHGTGLVIPNFYSLDARYIKHFGLKKLNAGQVVCIEPMLTFKDKRGIMASNGWSLYTGDKKYSAMFEHMILVKEDGYEVLTDHFIKA